ncbi:hypothetical protein [Falsiroseomonas selenitidurans]|uniref:Uncharacterized protein n=1 Tax=Falsiroseomonas selenitidurans TaxID=2716335 RepID=A0ABX1DX09_9PROT|nr:hypothetical protein [Falsiroseomonas selenitidurans]NKC29424.1 hypothetical protein [Falsiroseomonas selenitidurans]
MKRPRREKAPPASPLPRETLAAAMQRVAGDYAEFVASWPRGEVPPDPKAFAAHQAAARAALAHMAELAAMTGHFAGQPEEAAPDDAQLLAMARAQMAREEEA